MESKQKLYTRSVLLAVAVLFAASRAPAQTASVAPRITQAVDENNLVVLRGNVHPLIRGAGDLGAVSDAQPLTRMLLLLKRSPDQEAALQNLLDQQQSKSSANYHKWLTPEQFGQEFGPADADIQAVTNWLESQGFQVTQITKGRTVIEFSGNVAQVRNAFHTQMRRYSVNGEEHIANASDPQIPAALAPVVAGVVSLNNFPRKSYFRKIGTFQKSRATGEVKPLFTFPGCQSGNCYALGPADFATIYNTAPLLKASPPVDGTGVTIAIVGESNINVQDVTDFRTIFGLPLNFTNQNVILNGPDPGINGSEGESDLDIEWSGAVAPGATIDFVTSEPTETTAGIDLSAVYIVDNNLAAVMSESFGACEQYLGSAGNQFYNQLWEQAAAQGITVMLSTGDGGSAGCDDFNSQQTANLGLAVSGLASTPFNIAVGGRILTRPGGNRRSGIPRRPLRHLQCLHRPCRISPRCRGMIRARKMDSAAVLRGVCWTLWPGAAVPARSIQSRPGKWALPECPTTAGGTCRISRCSPATGFMAASTLCARRMRFRLPFHPAI